jgi:transposase
MTKSSYLPKEFDIFVGLDVDKKSYAVNVRDHDIVNRSKTMPAIPKVLVNYIRKRFKGKKVICAYEAGPTGFGLYDYLVDEGIPCLVVSPVSIPKAKNEIAKTNKIDARKLAEYLKYGKLRSIHVPVGEYRELRHLLRVREKYATQRKVSKQRIKALLLQESLDIKDVNRAWSKEYEENLKEMETKGTVRYRLEMLLEDLEYARRQLALAHKTLREFCKGREKIEKYRELLQTIPGIGFITAFSILGIVGDPGKLENAKQLAAFTGMIPWERSTGEEVNKGCITHMGNKVLRSMLVEAAWVTIRVDTRLNQFFHRVRNRNHPRGASRKAIVAVARKMTQIIFGVLTEERAYIKA